MVRLLVRAAIAVVVMVAPGTVGAQAEADVATGCLTRSGRITKVAIGDQPARPCRSHETEITLRLGGGEGDRELVHFSIAMERDGPEQTIATNGPLELFARCSSSGEGTLFRIFVTSQLDGWWISGDLDFPVDAGEERSMFGKSTTAETRLFKGSEVVPTASTGTVLSAVAPDGSYIAIEPDTLGIGLNILGHDCIAVGTAMLIKGTLE